MQEGSTAKNKWTGVKASYTDLYNELKDSGILVSEGDICRFIENYAFKSTSAAGAVVNGRSTAGPREWK